MRVGPAVLALVTACGGDGGTGAVVTVSVEMGGASAAVVEHEVLEPMEQALMKVRGVRGLRGRAVDGGAVVDVSFAWDADVAQTRSAVVAVQRAIPPDAMQPVVEVRPAAWVLVRASDDPRVTFAQRERLWKAPVVRVETCGVREARLSIELAPAKLAAFGVSAAQVAEALRVESELPSGRVGTAGSAGVVRVLGGATARDDVADTVVAHRDVVVRVRDLAVITERAEADCLVVGGGALLRVGVRTRGQQRAIEKALVREKLKPLAGAITIERRGGRPREIELVTAPHGPVVEAVLSGDDVFALADVGRAALTTLREAPGVAAAWCLGCEPANRENLVVDRARAAQLGVDPGAVAQALRLALEGELVAEYEDGDRRLGVLLGVEGGTRWGEVPLEGASGAMVRLGDLVKVEVASGPREIVHVDRRRAVVVRVRGEAKTGVSELRKRLGEAMKSAGPTVRVRLVEDGELDGERW